MGPGFTYCTMQTLTEKGYHSVAPEIRPGFNYIIFLSCEHLYFKNSFSVPS
jgi:hypothetical protein